MKKIIKFKEILAGKIGAIPHSRVHLMKAFFNLSASCYVKREDELGFGMSGSKLRKYASLIPFLIKENYQEAVIIGSAYSNNVLGLSQLLIENNIKPTLFLLGDSHNKRQGNLLLTSLLVPDSQIQWLTRKDWPEVQTKAANYAKNNFLKTIVIAEGCCMPEALAGACTLAIDILENETELQDEFDHIFLDAGTGLTAIAVILVFAWLKKKTKIHVLLLADTEKEFFAKLQQFKITFEQLVGENLVEKILMDQFVLHRPTEAPSFGAVNTTVFKTIKTIAQSEGFFTDPIYSAKLFYEANKIIQQQFLKDNILIVHSGGALTLMGFQEQLAKLV